MPFSFHCLFSFLVFGLKAYTLFAICLCLSFLSYRVCVSLYCLCSARNVFWKICYDLKRIASGIMCKGKIERKMWLVVLNNQSIIDYRNYGIIVITITFRLNWAIKLRENTACSRKYKWKFWMIEGRVATNQVFSRDLLHGIPTFMTGTISSLHSGPKPCCTVVDKNCARNISQFSINVFCALNVSLPYRTLLISI